MRVCFLFISFHLFFHFSIFQSSNSLGDAAVVRTRLDKFYLDRIDVVRAFPERTFHYLVTLSRLVAWGLGPMPTAENLGHEETTCRRKYGLHFVFISFLFPFHFSLTNFPRHRYNYNEGK